MLAHGLCKISNFIIIFRVIIFVFELRWLATHLFFETSHNLGLIVGDDSEARDMNDNNTTQNNQHTGYTDAMLPELSQEDIEAAESVHCKSWVLRKLEGGRVGSFNWSEELCLGLQITGEDSMRCFAAGNIQFALRSLAMLKHTCASVGVVFETEGYTMLIEPDSEDTETAEPVGMEVA